MESDDAAHAFAALGQGTRLDLLRTLLRSGGAGLPAGEIAARLAVPPSTLSFHLRALEQAGLIAATRDGRSLIYAARIPRLQALLGFVAEACPAELGQWTRSRSQKATTMTPAPFQVLFLCSRNAARSIMAEAILGKLAPERYVAHSAGYPGADRHPAVRRRPVRRAAPAARCGPCR